MHILNLIFGENIIVYRLFSAITIALTAILGYTHIRKDFGEKVGFWFSFLTLMLPVSAQYAGEIRMYSLLWSAIGRSYKLGSIHIFNQE